MPQREPLRIRDLPLRGTEVMLADNIDSVWLQGRGGEIHAVVQLLS